MSQLQDQAAQFGLSPLARRNRLIGPLHIVELGPISARAEEPAVAGEPACVKWAYLRSRGGTLTS